MNKLCISCFLLFFVSTTNINSQNVKTEKQSEYYWFSVEVYDYEWEDGICPLNLRSSIKTGNLRHFKRWVKKNLKKSRLLIGPFMSKTQAEFAVKVFNDIMFKKQCNYTDQNYLFFPVEINERKNTGVYYTENIGNDVNIGTVETFITLFKEGLKKSQFLIGPFNSETFINNETFFKFY